MKKINPEYRKYPILVLLFLIFMNTKTYAEGEDCSNGYKVTPDDNPVQTDYLLINSDRTVWFNFIANDADLQITTYENEFSDLYSSVESIIVYDNDCSSLNEIAQENFTKSNFGIRYIHLSNLLIGSEYKVLITLERPLPYLQVSFFNLSSAALSPCSPNATPISASIDLSALSGTNVVGQNFLFGYGNASGITLTISQNTTITNCNFVFGPNSKIFVANDAILTIQNSHFFGCSSMWKGIRFQTGRDISLVIENNSLIEDAETAIYADNNSISRLNISGSIFNNNLEDIIIKSSYFTKSANISNSIFTCRNFSSLNQVLSVSSLKNTGFYSESNALSLLPHGLLKNPYSQLERSFAGILVSGCTGTISPFTYAFNIGVPGNGIFNYNLFDNKDYGVKVDESNVLIQNNHFQFMEHSNLSGSGCGVYGSTTQATGSIMIVGGNALSVNTNEHNFFYNCGNSIYIDRFMNQSIVGNTIRSANTSNVINNGINGIAIFPRGGGAISISNNSIKNSRTSILINPISFPAHYISFNVNNNFLYTDIADLAYSGIVHSMAAPFIGLTRVNITANTINDAQTGIKIDGAYYSGTFLINQNSITIRKPNINTTANGIFCSSQKFVYITANTIIGDYSGTTIDYSNPYVFSRGIELLSTTGSRVYCNAVSKFEQDIVFRGICSVANSDIVYTNTLSDASDGLALYSATIGPQGSAVSPTDNEWVNLDFGFTHAQTYTELTNFNSPHFFIRNAPGTIYYPTNNKNSVSTLAIWQFNPLLNLSTSGTRAHCSPCIDCNPPPSAVIEMLEALIKEASQFNNYTTEEEWQNKKYVFEKLSFDTAYSNLNDSTLNAFKDSVQNTNLAKVVGMEEFLKIQQYSLALSLSNLINPENQLETNLKAYIKIYCSFCLNPNRVWSQFELNTLRTIAEQCYLTGGEVVVQAQHFLSYLNHQYPSYEGNCNGVSTSRKQKLIQPITSDGKFQDDYNILPNPAKDFITIKHPRLESLVELTISSVSGENFLKFIEPKNDKVDISFLPAGLYFYKCKFDSGRVNLGKIIVIK